MIGNSPHNSSAESTARLRGIAFLLAMLGFFFFGVRYAG